MLDWTEMGLKSRRQGPGAEESGADDAKGTRKKVDVWVTRVLFHGKRGREKGSYITPSCAGKEEEAYGW